MAQPQFVIQGTDDEQPMDSDGTRSPRPSKRSSSSSATGSNEKRTCLAAGDEMKVSERDVAQLEIAVDLYTSESKQVTNEWRMSRQRKSRRRSSFSRGRKSLLLPGVASSDICTTIDTSLPSDERLAELYQKAFQHTLDQLNIEFGNMDSIQQFNAIATHEMDDIISRLKVDGLFKNATAMKNNCVTQVTDAQTSAVAQYIQQLQKESSDWDNILELRTRLAKEAKRDAAEKAETITESTVSLSANKKRFLTKRPNYTALESMARKREQLLLEATEIQKETKITDAFIDAASSHLQQHAQTLHAHTFSDIKDFEDPFQLVSNVLHPPTTT